MLRKKLYLIIALLAYTPILLGSDKNPHDLSEKHILVGVQLKGQQKPECVFASEYVTGNQIYQALQKTKHYAGRVKQLILYTERQPKEKYLKKEGGKNIEKGTIIWSEKLSKPNKGEISEADYKKISNLPLSYLKENSKEDHFSLGIDCNYVIWNISYSYYLWYNSKVREEEKKQEGKLDLQKDRFLNLNSRRGFLIVNEKDKKPIQILKAEKGKILFYLYIQVLKGEKFQIESKDPSYLTVYQLKKKLQPIVGHEPEKQRVIWRGSELEDDKETLMERDISSGATVYLAFRSSQNSPVQRKNPNSMLLPALGIAALVVGAGLVLYLLVKKAQKKDKKDSKILDSVHNKRS